MTLSQRLGFESIWAARMLAGDDTLFAERFSALEQSVLRDHEPASQALAVDEVDVRDFDRARFERAHVCRRPLVIRRALEGTDVVDRWNLPFFAERFGSTRVQVHGHAQTGENLYDKDIVGTRLADFIDAVQAREGAPYMVASAGLFEEHPELTAAVPVKRLQGLFDIRITRPELFMGNEKNWSPWHNALAEKFFVQGEGQKQWSFIDPSWTAAMYPNYGWVTGPTAVQTTVDRDRIEDFPMFALPQRMTCVVGPGDLVYNPPHWWHEVRNLGASIGMPLRVRPRHSLRSPFLFISKLQVLHGMRHAAWRKVLWDAVADEAMGRNLLETRKGDAALEMTYSAR